MTRALVRSARGQAVNEGSNRYRDSKHRLDLLTPPELEALWRERELFPTQPWNVRAALEVLGPRIWPTWPQIPPAAVVYEPCAGLGHMVTPLREVFDDVRPSDIEDWGTGFPAGDALAFEADSPPYDSAAFTNPPFTLADQIVRQLQKTCDNVVILARLGLICGASRYPLHYENPIGNLTTFIPCTERAPMVLGYYDPKADKPQEFAWFHYQRGYRGNPTTINLKPGSKARLMRPEDVKI